MKDLLAKVLKVVNFLWKVLPILLDAIQDLADDGVINGSSSRSRGTANKADAKAK